MLTYADDRYDLCRGTIDGDYLDMSSPVSVDVLVMMVGPLPLDLYPATLTKGYQAAWVALALNLDSNSKYEREGALAISLSKFDSEMVGKGFELIGHEGTPAMWMYRAAAHAKMAQAQLNLAIWYVHGRHVPRSLPQACYWFERAAEAGLQDAQYNLGLLLLQGKGIAMDHKKAAALFQLAVEQGHIDAHLSLGMCYLEGICTFCTGKTSFTRTKVQILTQNVLSRRQGRGSGHGTGGLSPPHSC